VDHRPRTDLGVALGCRLDEDGYLDIDVNGRTSVEGVYAAGDLVSMAPAVVQALATGQRAAVGVTRDLSVAKT
ncbi:MAG TPA: FAD-dependent oxidoreductase, partial [Dokdonella sp.]|nr:FAD-dependent oxidoreductase [Dokdonella sp.]